MSKGLFLGSVLFFCSGCKATADVAFLVDSSGSIGRRRWPLMINFLKEVTNVFNVGPDGTHIAVIAYSSDAKLEFTFNTLSGAQITAEEYGNLIDKIDFQRGFTYIDKALIMADEQVFTTSAGMRPGVPQVTNLTKLHYSNWLIRPSLMSREGSLVRARSKGLIAPLLSLLLFINLFPRFCSLLFSVWYNDLSL